MTAATAAGTAPVPPAPASAPPTPAPIAPAAELTRPPAAIRLITSANSRSAHDLWSRGIHLTSPLTIRRSD